MPIYTYKCTQCKHTFESIHRMADRKRPEKDPCPECGAYDTIQQIIVSNYELMAPDQLGRIKPNEDWRGFLNKLKKNNPGSDFTTY